MRCPNCGNENVKNVKYCRICGTELIRAPEQKTINQNETENNNDEIKKLIGKISSDLQCIENQFKFEINRLEKEKEELRSPLARLKEENYKTTIDLALYKNSAEEAEIQVTELKNKLKKLEDGLMDGHRIKKPEQAQTTEPPNSPPLPNVIKSELQSDCAVKPIDGSDRDTISFNSNAIKTESRLNQQMKSKPFYCPECGKEINVNTRFCPTCGMKIK